MQSTRPKVLHPLCGRPLVAWVVEQAAALEPERIVLVVGDGAGEVERAARAAAGTCPLETVLQEPQLGTGHALSVSAPALADAERVVALYGDMPLLRSESVAQLIEAQGRAGAGAIALLTGWDPEPTGYGRILRATDGTFLRIVEERDATAEEREVGEINLGVYCFDGPALRADLPRLENANTQGEYYATDLPTLAQADGRPVVTVELSDPVEALGVNSLAQLAEARFAMQMRILEGHMAAGVLIDDPATTYVEHGVEIGAGTRVLPCTVIRSGVTIGEGCEVGPFTHLREGTLLEDRAEVGNFTEMKESTLGQGSKAKHLAYLGDTRIGARTNIGAGTIFANYDGEQKHRTRVGDDVFVGSGTIVVAPNELPDGSTTGAGAVVTRSAHMQPGDVYVGLPARKFEKRRKPAED